MADDIHIPAGEVSMNSLALWVRCLHHMCRQIVESDDKDEMIRVAKGARWLLALVAQSNRDHDISTETDDVNAILAEIIPGASHTETTNLKVILEVCDAEMLRALAGIAWTMIHENEEVTAMFESWKQDVSSAPETNDWKAASDVFDAALKEAK